MGAEFLVSLRYDHLSLETYDREPLIRHRIACNGSAVGEGELFCGGAPGAQDLLPIESGAEVEPPITPHEFEPAPGEEPTRGVLAGRRSRTWSEEGVRILPIQLAGHTAPCRGPR